MRGKRPFYIEVLKVLWRPSFYNQADEYERLLFEELLFFIIPSPM